MDRSRDGGSGGGGSTQCSPAGPDLDRCGDRRSDLSAQPVHLGLRVTDFGDVVALGGVGMDSGADGARVSAAQLDLSGSDRAGCGDGGIGESHGDRDDRSGTGDLVGACCERPLHDMG